LLSAIQFYTHRLPKAKRLHSSNAKREYGFGRCQALQARHMQSLIVDFTSAFNTTDHDKLLWIMYDFGFPTDAIDAVKNLYMEARTKIQPPSGAHRIHSGRKRDHTRRHPFPSSFSDI
jgi:hypothetical protein